MLRVLGVFVAICAISSAQKWRIIDSDVLTTDLGVAFVSENLGYTAGDLNGKGPAILKSVDGGHHFEICNATYGPDVLLMDMDAALNTAVVSSIFGELYSDDAGRSFHLSRGGGTSQSVRYIGLNGDGGKKYGVTGQYGRTQGVAISTNGGRTFDAFDAKLDTLARYGAFPTDTTWYVAAGEWPSDTSSTKPKHMRLRRTEYLNDDGTMNTRVFDAPKTGDGYKAQISKTTDGGKTWSSVFEDTQFYFNGIDCSPHNESICCAVGEASGTNQSGARIHCTQNGGKSWTRSFWAPSTSTLEYSLIELRYASDTEVWAIGGQLTRTAPSAWFVHSTDGGKTWASYEELFRGYYGLGISMVNAKIGYVAMDNLITQDASIAKYGGI